MRRTSWGSSSERPTGPPYKATDLPLTYVLIAQVAVTCLDIPQCSTVVRDIQRCDKASDVPFNFLVGGDGNTYEGQGWRNQSLMSLPVVGKLATDSFLFLAFIGMYT